MSKQSKMKLKPDPTVFLFRYRFLDEATTSMLKSWALSLALFHFVPVWTLAIHQFDFKGLKDLNRLRIQNVSLFIIYMFVKEL